MTAQVSRKNFYIELFRKNGFLCFAIERYTNGKDQKAGGRGWQNTKPNQTIKENENYGVKPILGKGTALLDLDDKERYRKYAEELVKSGYMVIETGNGWHIPVIGLSGEITKMELFNYKVQDTKIIEIQSPKQYCIGAGSVIFHTKLNREVTYTNVGNDKIYDAKGQDFNDYVDEICEKCTVTGKRQGSGKASSYKYLRDQFLKGIPPTEHTSNDYFHQAALQCNTDNLSRDEAFEKIQKIYDKWENQTRGWSNIETKINEVYDKDDKITKGGHRASKTINRTEIAQDFLNAREFYCEGGKNAIVYENKKGFLESVNDTLNKELYESNPEIEEADFNSILWKIKSGAKEVPETNKDEIVFGDIKIDVNTRKISETNDIADMGFKQYNYLSKTKTNEPKEFLELFDNIKDSDHKRLNAGLRGIFNGRLDSRISVIHGLNRVGKSTILNILCKVLGDEYAYSVDLEIFLEDRATMSEIDGKRLVVFQDLPEDWKQFTMIKNLTGEEKVNIRKFNKAAKPTDNKIKIFASANHLPEIKKSAKDSMYSARLSLVHNTRTEKYPEDPRFAERIAKEEGEKIVSYIINLTDDECEYEDSETIRAEWEGISTPEIDYLKENWKPVTFDSKKLLIELVEESGLKIDMDRMANTMESMGYNVIHGLIKNIESLSKD
jgi:hypothetical protein